MFLQKKKYPVICHPSYEISLFASWPEPSCPSNNIKTKTPSEIMNNNIKFQANAAKKWVECARFHCYNWEVKWYISYSEKLYKEGDKKKKVYSFIFFFNSVRKNV